MASVLADPSQPAAAGQMLIRIEALHKYYDMGETRVHALRGVSLGIAQIGRAHV